MIDYTKPALTISEQISLLEKRGLTVNDQTQAKQFLEQVGYYRLSPYFIPFESSRHRFKNKVQFEHIANLYELDRQLRNEIDEALEWIEIALRSKISNIISLDLNPFAHEDQNNFKNQILYQKWIEHLHEESTRSKELFITHYKSKYYNFPKLPIWMAVETMSFGVLSRLYKNLNKKTRIGIAKSVCLHDSVLESWLHALTYIRNLCAHHSRLWNRTLGITPKLPKSPDWFAVTTKRRIVITLLIISDFMKRLKIGDELIINWKKRIFSIVSNQGIPNINVQHQIGIRFDLNQHNLWR